MTVNEIVTICVSITSLAVAVGSLAVAIVALRRSSRGVDVSNGISSEQLKLSHANVELSLRKQVQEASVAMGEFAEQHADFLASDPKKLNAEDKKRRERLKAQFATLKEAYLNALENACRLLIEGKTDPNGFENAFRVEIRKVVTSQEHATFFGPGSTYFAIMKVYNDWENPHAKRKTEP